MQLLTSSLANIMSEGMNPYSGKGGPFEEEDIISTSDDGDEEKIEITCDDEIESGEFSCYSFEGTQLRYL
jgi:hypothetical protein